MDQKIDVKINPPCSEFKIEDTNCFSILSWNIMHKTFDDPNDYPNCNEKHLLWKYRLPKIKKKIFQHNADIVCLQEIDKPSFADDIGDYFKTNYGYNYLINIPKKSKVDHSTAIMFKKSKFICKYFDFRTRSTIILLTNKEEELNCLKCNNNDNLCLYHSFFIVTVHLAAKGSAFKCRMNQTKSLLNRIKYCIQNELKLNVNLNEINKYIRIIIIGDFNTWRQGPLTKMLLLNNNDTYKHNYQFKDAYHQAILCNYNDYLQSQKFKNNFEFDDPNIRIKLFPSYAGYNKIYAIDLCFYTQNNLILKAVNNTLPSSYKDRLNWNNETQKRIDVKARDPKLLDFWQNMACFNDILHLPDDEYPSDHLPIAVLFKYNNLCEIKNKDNNKCICCKIGVNKNKKKHKKNNCNDRNHKKHPTLFKLVNNDPDNWRFYRINSF